MAVAVNLDGSGPVGSCAPERKASTLTVGSDYDMVCVGGVDIFDAF